MKANGRLVQRIESRHTAKGVRIILWGKVGRGTPVALGELRSALGPPAELLKSAIAAGRVETEPKTAE